MIVRLNTWISIILEYYMPVLGAMQFHFEGKC